MLDYLQKYKELPEKIRAAVSSPEVMLEIDKLEKLYKVELATVIVRIMIREMLLGNLASHFVLHYGMEDGSANSLVSEIKSKVLVDVMEYLNRETKSAPISVVDKYQKLDEIQSVIASSRQVDKSKSANFFFSPEDEEEVRKISQQIETTPKTEVNNVVKQKLDAIVKESEIVFSSSFISERFEQLLMTFLRGIRNKIETKEALIRPFNAGGLALDSILADKILSIASKYVDTSVPAVPKKPFFRVPEDSLVDNANNGISKDSSTLGSIGMRDIEYNLAAEIAKRNVDKNSTTKISEKNEFKPKRIEPNENIVGNLDLSHELAPLTPVAVKTKESKGNKDNQENKPGTAKKNIQADGQTFYSIKPQMIKPTPTSWSKVEMPIAEPVPVEVIKPAQVLRVSNSDSKARMEDVKYVPLIMDAVSELRYLTLVNFRRLSSNPVEAVKKLKDKLAVLEEEKYAKRLEGIKALRLSPLNKLYLQMGQESIVQGMSIDYLVEKKKAAGLETLEVKEFEAIMDLNRGLRF